jgi:DNA replication protein DnaC
MVSLLYPSIRLQEDLKAINKQTDMNTSQTLDQLRELKLNGMHEHYQEVLRMPSHDQPDSHELIAMLTQSELLYKTNRKTQKYVKDARFRYQATLEGIDYHPERNLNKNQLLTLASCSFIKRGENVIITGATGCGKSYIATALGYRACSLGYKTLYLNMSRLDEQLLMCEADATRSKFLSRLSRAELLIMDDFGLSPMTQRLRMALLQIMEDRYDRKAVIITSQLPFTTWYDYLNEPTLADAIMDRLSVTANRLDLEGESLRKKFNKK